jgi:hypothetical protein
MDTQPPARTVDIVEPEVADTGGYRLRQRDLRFIGVDHIDFSAWHARERPLGLSAIQFSGLVTELRAALARDAVPISTCDVRLKGSAASIFSGTHKRTPADRDAVSDLFRELRQSSPRPWQLDEIMSRFFDGWITDGDIPTNRVFDSMYQLGITRYRSDIDLQLSSDLLVAGCEAVLVELGQEVTELRTRHPTYNFVRKDLVEAAFPNLFFFSRRMSEAVDRHVSLAVFPSKGPRDVSKAHPGQSAHFRREDWILNLAGHEPTGSP